MLAILSIHCSFLHYERIDTMGLPYVLVDAVELYEKGEWVIRLKTGRSQRSLGVRNLILKV